MTVLGRLLAGDGTSVLQTCRIEGLGGEAYGREAVQRAAATLSVGQPRHDIETARAGLWLDEEVAIIADLVENCLQRLWVMSDRTVLTPSPSIDVPVDPDLKQADWGVRFDPLDHPELHRDDAARLSAAVAAWPVVPVSRVRPIIFRAVSAGTVAFALVRLEGEAAGPSRQPMAMNGVVVLAHEGTHHRVDEAGRQGAADHRWTPAFGSPTAGL